MKNKLLFVAGLFSAFVGFSQEKDKDLLKKTEETVEKIKDEKPNGWDKKGVFTLLANQASFTNWQAGGQSSVSGNIGLNYDINYKSDRWSWDNKIVAAYGLSKINGQELQKTDDRVGFNSLLGYKASGYWYYSGFLNFKTQFDSGIDPENQGIKNSHFFSPAYFQIGPGLMWKKSDDFKFNFAPVTSRVIIVHSHFTEFGSSFGVEQGESLRYEFGASFIGYYKFNVMENVTAENILNLYSNYLERPKNIDLDYTLNIVMKINKSLTTNFAFQTIYDDNAFRGFQIREVIGLGVNYTF
ncbi:MAG: DUF3078 domain-containing protein [Flavobacterium sp.]